ncbi:MAG: hypothetical protein MR405_01485 [Mollicutes bacterium]|nr:hypothetical protein [Intestinibacter sp.]MCI5542583.1 hypothetical protein [Mollicutes bacterium]MDY2735725.1 hypothetical protein [Intestinibacter sp.]
MVTLEQFANVRSNCNGLFVFGRFKTISVNDEQPVKTPINEVTESNACKAFSVIESYVLSFTNAIVFSLEHPENAPSQIITLFVFGKIIDSTSGHP